MAKKGRPDPAEAADGGGFDMTPMIDVTFLLIIFFMCVTEMADSSKSKLKLPVVFNGEVDEGLEPGRLLINIMQDGKVQVNARNYSDAELNTALRSQYVMSVANASANALSDKPVMLRSDKRAKYKDVQRIMQLCMDNKLWKISFTALGPEAANKED